jgi:hypothetical protein
VELTGSGYNVVANDSTYKEKSSVFYNDIKYSKENSSIKLAGWVGATPCD